MTSADAYFDMLVLGSGLTDLVQGFTRSELHLFAYSSCLLSLYDQKPMAEWGYDFVSSENGLPFSSGLDECIENALAIGHLHRHQILMAVTADGRAELTELRQLGALRSRERYLEGAADSVLVFSPGTVREAFNYDPSISFLKKGNRTDWVLTQQMVDRFYENFRQLRSALDYKSQDLSVPLVNWLKYLLSVGRHGSHERPTKN